jgi:hypothetical protein
MLLAVQTEDADEHPEEVRHTGSDGQALMEACTDVSQTHEEVEEEAEMFLNTCCRCGETLLLVIDVGDEFVCEEAGKICSNPAAIADTLGYGSSQVGAPPVAKSATAEYEQEETNHEDMPLRTRLLRRILDRDLTTLATADLFLRHGEEPPKPQEISACREEIQRRAKERKAIEKHEAAREAAKASQKKQQRYIGGQLVDVQKGSRYLVEPKESATEKAKTSISITIQGQRRANTSGEEKKKGPRS